MNYLLCAVVVSAAAALFFLRERQWYAQEEIWRVRERKLIDEVLRYAHVPGIDVKVERVAKIADPEASPPFTAVDEVFWLDDIKEELEQSIPEAEEMTVEQVKAAYPMEWMEAERLHRQRVAPLRI